MNQIEQKLTSMEVAKMVEKDHKELLRDIRRYVSQLGESKIALTDFFTESSYMTSQKKKAPCYKITKKGCEFIANKLTGVKGTAFTARYINRFHEMEDSINGGKSIEDKSDKIKVMEMNARTRMARTYMQLANVDTLSSEYKNILVAKASETLSGEQLLPLPKTQKKTYSAKEIGDILGITACKVGIIANKNNLKTEKFGEYYRDKSQHSSREVDTFRYFENAIEEFKKYI